MDYVDFYICVSFFYPTSPISFILYSFRLCWLPILKYIKISECWFWAVSLNPTYGYLRFVDNFCVRWLSLRQTYLWEISIAVTLTSSLPSISGAKSKGDPTKSTWIGGYDFRNFLEQNRLGSRNNRLSARSQVSWWWCGWMLRLLLWACKKENR